jgi:ABC-type multidrug transport system ATPase subunit
MPEEVQVDPVLKEAAVENQDLRKQGNEGDSSSSAAIVSTVDSPGSRPRASTTSESVSKADLLRASAKTESLAKPDLTVSWEHLTVHVEATGCQCRVSPFDFYAQEYLGVAVESRNAVNALEDVSGHVKTGEMVLVLSSEQACASALLRTLSGRTVDEVQGTMSLNGISLTQDVWQSWRRIAPYVSADDNSHAPVLTVRETLLFAAQCTNDGTLAMEQLNERIDRLLQALDLAHVADTVVGNEDLRGISGGQKRRVTVGEMLTSRHVSLLALENITDGLASTDSYSLLSLLKAACATVKVAAIISLLQPSDDMVALFDKILVLNPQGEMAYFGPVDRVLLRQVFLGEGEKDEGSICDLVLASKNDSQQDAVLKRYHGSTVHQEMVLELNDIRSKAPPARNRDIRVFLPDTKYASHWRYQFQVIGARRLKLVCFEAHCPVLLYAMH